MAKTFTCLELEEGFEQLYCPFCGSVLPLSDGSGSTACPHFLFDYNSEVGEFSYVADRYKAQAETIMERCYGEDDIDLDIDPPQALLDAIDSDSCLALALVMSSMACGPVSDTTYVAVDFAAPCRS